MDISVQTRLFYINSLGNWRADQKMVYGCCVLLSQTNSNTTTNVTFFLFSRFVHRSVSEPLMSDTLFTQHLTFAVNEYTTFHTSPVKVSDMCTNLASSGSFVLYFKKARAPHEDTLYAEAISIGYWIIHITMKLRSNLNVSKNKLTVPEICEECYSGMSGKLIIYCVIILIDRIVFVAFN